MKPIFVFVFLFMGMNLFSQENSQFKFIFVPHPRTEDNINQSVIPGIANIDFTKFDVKMLGGDLTYSTSKNSATLTYCDKLFDLKNPNTLWSFGNHDVESGNRALIKQFTGRDSYYAYTRNGVTFIVLDTELDAVSFKRTFITGDQLQMVKNVCDTIANSKFLILLHSRFIWMINNDYFKQRLTDSIAASSRSMDTTNFYSDIYPLLQKVKARGIQVKIFGGDKSKINVTYSPEDRITFYAARMANDFADSVNNLIVISYNQKNSEMNCNYVTLADFDKKNQDSLTALTAFSDEQVLKVWQVSGSTEIRVQLQSVDNDHVLIQIYSINGVLYQSVYCKTNEILKLNLNRAGIYIAKAFVGNSVQVRKFVFQ
jgi:hypothetical protein